MGFGYGNFQNCHPIITYLVYDGKRYKIDSPYDDKFVISKLTKVIEKLLEYNARKKRRKVYKRKQTVPNNSPTSEKADKVENNQYGNLNKVPPQQIVSAISRDLNPKYEDARAVEYRKDLIKMLEDQAKVKETVFKAITADLARSTKLLQDKDDDIRKRAKELHLLESKVNTEKNRLAITDKDYVGKVKLLKIAEDKLNNRTDELKKSRLEYEDLVKENEKLKKSQEDMKEANQKIDDLLNNKNISLDKKTKEIEKLNEDLRTRVAAFLELEKDIAQKEAERKELVTENELKNIELNRAILRKYYTNPNNISASQLRHLAEDTFKIDPIKPNDPRKNFKSMEEIVDEIVSDDMKLFMLTLHHVSAKKMNVEEKDVDLTKTPIFTPKGSAKKEYKKIEESPLKGAVKHEDLIEKLENVEKESEASGSKNKGKEPIVPKRSARLSAKEILNKSKVILSAMPHETLREFMKKNGHGDIMLTKGDNDKKIDAFLKKPGMVDKVIEDNEKKVLKDVEDKADELKKEVEEAQEAREEADKAKEKADEAEEEAEEEIIDVQDKLEELDNIAGVFNPDADQGGAGIVDSGLTNFEIEKFMKDYDKDGFIGVYAIDQLKKVGKVGSDFSLIMNTQPINVPIGHWIAVKVSKDTIEYYDSFAGDPPDELLKWLKKRLTPNVYQLKINRTKFQKANTSNCGYFAMDFLAKRYGGESFKEATGFKVFEDSIKGEKEIKKLKKSIQEFGFINIKK